MKNLEINLFNKEDQNVGSFKELAACLQEKKRVLKEIPTEAIIKILSSLGREMVRDTELLQKEGMFYLASWLRESNLLDYLETNFSDKNILDRYVKVKEKQIKAQPRGLVCHWIAENVPTLALFSLFQSIICKNSNILKISEDCKENMVSVVKKLENIRVDLNGKLYEGGKILETFSFVVFPYQDIELSGEMSKIADCKVIFGGKEAVKAIKNLPEKEHCETIIFGPKYSFAIIDEENAENSDIFKKIVQDIIIFNQAACSSPHVLFYEKKDGLSVKDVALKLKDAFEESARKKPKENINPSTLAKVINKRGEYFLDPEKSILCSKQLDWSILIDKNLQLEEPVGSRTIFLKEVKDVLDVVPLITNKVQTLGVALSTEKLIKLADEVSFKGIARVVPIGEMNNYDTPWDGLLFMNRLVRLCSVKLKE